MRINKVAGIAASVVFSSALVLGMATSAGAAPGLGSLDFGCSKNVTSTSATGWNVPADETAAVFTAEGLKFDNAAGGAVSLYKPAGGVDLADLTAEDFSYTFKTATAGKSVPALQVRVLDASTSKFDTGFATLVWHPAAGSYAADTWVTVTGDELAESGRWWLTGTDISERTFAAIQAANPDATVEHVGLQLAKSSNTSAALVSEFSFQGCVSTFTPGADAGSLGSLSSLGDLAGLGDLFGNLIP